MTVKLLAVFLLAPFACLQSQIPQRFDIVITELFPDPSPPVALPNHEFVELKNISGHAINLKGWKLSDGSATATIQANKEVQPDSFVIICPNSAVPLLTAFGTTIGVSNFPSLNNEEDIITLSSPEGNTIHAVAYSVQWYRNSLKTAGGWSLEMIDPRNPCAGADNWKAATDPQGGTPGKENSVTASNPDDIPPALLRTYTLDSVTIVAIFDESLDSTIAASNDHYLLDQTIGHPLSAEPQAPLFREVLLKLPVPLKTSQEYLLTAKGLTDCSGNTIGMMNMAKAGLPVSPNNQHVIINELLFNPPPGGYDYIELYNRSKEVVDIKQLYVANRSSTGLLSGLQQLSTTARLLFPGEYIVLTEDARWLRQQYNVKDPATIVELSSFPSLPDDKCTLVLVNLQEELVDELQYDRSWHFSLISTEDGVALERIDYTKPTQDSHNWMSAASTAGFGTPGYRNSQFRADLQAKGAVTVTPSLFSPDNDGVDDFATIQYQMEEPGYVANITLFDAGGVPVRQLARNATLGKEGVLRWDGLDNNRRRLPIGTYIMLAEIFNGQGKTKKFKNTVTLIRRF
jgi:hypothetical protein